jgi:hypothetical protein
MIYDSFIKFLLFIVIIIVIYILIGNGTAIQYPT